jgi:hypothetical protein
MLERTGKAYVNKHETEQISRHFGRSNNLSDSQQKLQAWPALAAGKYDKCEADRGSQKSL